jgi:hypothetical protein
VNWLKISLKIDLISKRKVLSFLSVSFNGSKAKFYDVSSLKVAVWYFKSSRKKVWKKNLIFCLELLLQKMSLHLLKATEMLSGNSSFPLSVINKIVEE